MQANINKEYLTNLRHSAAHLLAAAVTELWPKAKPTIGPAIDNGFYYDFDFPEPPSDSDLVRMEEKMKKIVGGWKIFERHEVTPDQARKEFAGNQYKLELIEEIIAAKEPLTVYQSGTFRDLCRGGHCDHPPKELKHFKLLSLAGAYWRGSEKNKMLTRIYGTAYPTKDELQKHLKALEEAKLRDHRKIGKELELFTFFDDVGKGLPIWLPKGTIMRNEVEKLAIEMEDRDGYLRVSTPHVAKEELFLKSGHLPYYKDSMYPPMTMDDGKYYLKAMHCPMHHLIYLNQPRSYRELPLRLAEYGTVYRNELSGTLAGLLRVRMLTMNDAHIYCRQDQLEDELTRVINLTVGYFSLFGLSDYWFRLSLWDPAHKEKYIDEPDSWELSQSLMRQLLKKLKVKFEEVTDEAAFYGPKIDVQFTSAVGRQETMSTIQLDFAAKKRFNLFYFDQGGKENPDVFVIHRAPLSTHERFTAFLIEHYAGNFPTWLAPTQVKIMSISSDHKSHAADLAAELNAAGIRAELDDHNETVGNKIRKAVAKRIPYLAVIGDKEVQSGILAVRLRGSNTVVSVERKIFVQKLQQEIRERSAELSLAKQ